MISGTYKAGVQTLKPGDLLREHSAPTGFVGDYVVLNAKIFPMTGNTVYTLYILGTQGKGSDIGADEKVGETCCITEDELYEGKSIQWSIQ